MNIKICLLAACLLGALPAFGQLSVITVAIPSTATNEVENTTPTGSAVPVDKQDFVGAQFITTGDDTDTGNLVLKFARSTDGSTFETTKQFGWAIPMNGTTRVIAYTNFPPEVIGGAKFIKVVSINNTNELSSGKTNSLKIILKRLPK